MADAEGASSSGETSEAIVKTEEFSEPDKKRRKVGKSSDGSQVKLEMRLGGILRCVVCLDLPKAAIYQASSVCFYYK